MRLVPGAALRNIGSIGLIFVFMILTANHGHFFLRWIKAASRIRSAAIALVKIGHLVFGVV
jgi:hypothetical protein